MKLLAIILTSGNLFYLDRCYQSIVNQRNHTFQVTILINVNTLSSDYYAQVLEHVKGYDTPVEVIRTESNGKPGKGHNSCFQAFKEREEDYMTMLDGDDLFFPVAFQQFEAGLKKDPDTDILFNTTNDKIMIGVPGKCEGHSLIENVILQSNFHNNFHIAKVNKATSPFAEKIKNLRTHGRIELCSRRIFDSPIPIQYCEGSNHIDDVLASMCVLENYYKKLLRIYSINDNDIYCYNGINDLSVTWKFDAIKYNEEDHYRNKNIALPQFKYINECWELSDIPYLHLGKSNFTPVDKVNFCKKVANNELNNLFQRLQKKMLLGKFFQAEQLVNKLLIYQVKDFRVYHYWGIIKYHQRNYKAAIDAWKDSDKYHPQKHNVAADKYRNREDIKNY